ncbi:hypothetical protein JNUCC24_19405 (plasmid) [Bacillus sp. JNUCC-24]|uniref:CD3337/EF1877 family mobilome membrane protein n=1 Tax=Bacillus sp. JNUCC-24 TaxID=2842458 RepID=UPI001C0B9E68|nr:hypothetical protein [Bacillus sp. JNUCC-24]QWS52498.1 hypothetical protein JNUCC24_19405 [Bacillus sp. JNUCC-24]
MKIKKLLLLLAVLMIILPTSISAAESSSKKEEDKNISETLVPKDYSKMEDGRKAVYYLDVSAKTGDEEDKNAVQQFVDSAKSWVTGDAIKDGIASQFFEFINLMVNLTFEWNKMFTNIMLAFLNFAFETDVVNAWIDLVERLVQGISGIEGSGFSSDGIFGSFIGFIVVITGLVAVFQMTFRRAIISGLSTIVQTVFVLSLALMILTNYGSFMKGINNISTTASQLILTGASNSLTGDHRTPEAVREDMSKNIWDLFIVKPYLIMQYAEEDIDKIGVDRVNKLLKMPKGQDRQDFIEKNEISENNNKMMTYERVPERAVFTFVYSPINALVSIPIYLLSLAVIVFQIWFLLIGFVSPFVLLWAAWPKNIGVLKRYSIELMYPLALKILATVAVLVVFSLGFLVYKIGSSGVISVYLILAFMQFILFVLMILLRKRIVRIFKAGNGWMFDLLRGDLKELQNSINGLNSAILKTGLAAATGGTSAAATAAATEVINQTGTGYSDNDAIDEPEDYSGGTAKGSIPLAKASDYVNTSSGTTKDKLSSSQDEEDENINNEQADGTKPLASASEYSDQQDEAGDESYNEKASHLQLVHNSEDYQDDDEYQEHRGDNPWEMSAIPEEAAASYEDEQSSNELESIDGTKPLGSIPPEYWSESEPNGSAEVKSEQKQNDPVIDSDTYEDEEFIADERYKGGDY